MTWANRNKTPRVIQMEAVECGAAALAIILGYYGRFISLEELRLLCGVSRDGVSAFNIVEAAKHLGLKGEGFETNIEGLYALKTPAILFWNNNHFVVLEKMSKHHAHINDPATGPRKISLAEVKNSYSGIALEFEPTTKFEKGGKNINFLHQLRTRFSTFRGAMIYLFFAQITLLLLGLAMPVFSRIFIDRFLSPSLPDWERSFIILLVVIMLLTGFMTWLRGKFLNALAVRLAIRYSTEFLWKLLRLPILFFTQRSTGEVISRQQLNEDIATIFTGEIVVNAMNLMIITLYAVVMFTYNISITLIGIGAAILNLLLLFFINHLRANAYAHLQQANARSIGVSLEMLEQIEAIKASGNESFFFSKIAGLYTRTINAYQSIGRKDIYLDSLSNFIQIVATTFLLGYGVWLVMNGVLTIGMLIAFQILLTSFLNPFQQLVTFGTQIESVKVDIARVDDVLQNQLDVAVQPRQEPVSLAKTNGVLTLHQLTFGYCPLDNPIIQDFSLQIEQGEHVALVAPVGSGKTTLAKLAAHLYHPWSGEVRYGGYLPQELERETLKHSVAYVDQHIHLFRGTLRDNLTLWDPTISSDILLEALESALLLKEVEKMPLGLETQLIDGGANLSQGQRQRLEIARALVHRPSILILDEATNSVEEGLEVEIMDHLKKRGVSSLVITHRSHLQTQMDRVIHLQKKGAD